MVAFKFEKYAKYPALASTITNVKLVAGVSRSTTATLKEKKKSHYL